MALARRRRGGTAPRLQNGLAPSAVSPLLALALLVASPCTAQAQAQAPASAPTTAPARDDGKALLSRGVARFDDGGFAAARALLDKARAALPAGKQRARAELYLGFVHAAENRAAMARAAFGRALADDPALQLDRQRHKPALLQMFGEVRRRRVGTLRVESDRAGAEVRVDGSARRRVPFDAPLLAGVHSVELTAADGSLLRRERVTVAAGATTRLVLAVTARTATPPKRADGGRADGRSPRRRGRPGVVTYTLAAGALAAAAVAIGLGLSASSDRDDACALLLDTQKPCGERSLVGAADRGRYLDLHDSASSKTLGANISWGIASGLLAASIVALVLEWRAPVRAEVSLGRHGAVAGLRLTY